jgi:hypothetical protein
MELDGVERELDLGTMLISEARELKRLTGWDYISWRDQLAQSDPDAIAFSWWLVNRRAGTPLPGSFADLDFDMTALNVVARRTDDDEVAGDDKGDDANAEGPTGSEPDSSPDPT